MNYAEWPLSAPVNLTWEITHKCNLACIHCLSSSAQETPGELDFEECKTIVDQLDALKVFEINFGGGEPFLKSYFIDLVEYIHTKGIVTCISTNGTVFNDKTIACFSRNPLINIQVSLDGATPEINDRIRGEGTFKNILRGIKLLVNRSIPFSINTVVTSVNFQQLDQLRELANSFGAGMRVSRFRPSGRAKASWDLLKLKPVHLESLSGWLNEYPQILTGDSFFSISGKGRRELGLDMCGACKLTCCIDPCGSVYPCAFLQENEFWSGNLKDTTFKNIWDSSSVFQRFRRLEPSACTKCGRFNICRGGCPAVAYFANNDINSSDPECLINWKKIVSAQNAA